MAWPPLALLRTRLRPAISIIHHGEWFLGSVAEDDGVRSTGSGFWMENAVTKTKRAAENRVTAISMAQIFYSPVTR